MAEEAQAKVQASIKQFVNTVDQQHLRAMERSMHECAANCCSNKTASIDQVHSCVEKCQAPTFKAQRFVQTELERFQEGLSRCVLQCQEDIKDLVTPNASDAEIAKFRSDFEACAVKCCDQNIARLPQISKRVEETLAAGKF